MGRRRQIHHDQAVAAKLESDEGYAACAPNEALDMPKGSFVIWRRPRAAFLDKPAALTELRKKYPTEPIQFVRHARYWVWRVQTKRL